MQTRQELILQFLLAISANPQASSIDKMYSTAELLADKYLSNL